MLQEQVEDISRELAETQAAAASREATAVAIPRGDADKRWGAASVHLPVELSGDSEVAAAVNAPGSGSGA